MDKMTKKLNDKIKENGVSADGYWQSILDIGYNEWQKSKNSKWTYESMIDWVREKYGDFAATMILVGKFNQQVCNGGHRQYYDNGYASHGGGCFTQHGDDIRLHNELLDGMKKLKLDKATDLSKKVYDIMSRFKVEIDDEPYTEDCCYECGGSGQVENPDYDYEDEDSEVMTECSNCGGSGYDEVDNPEYGEPYNTYEWDQLDNEYYALDEEWVEYVEMFVKNYLEVGEDILAVM